MINKIEEYEPTISDRVLGIIWRSILVGCAYTITVFAIGTILAKVGIPFPNTGSLSNSKLWFLGSSILMGFVIGGISQIVHTSKLNHFMTWALLLFLNPLSVTIETAFLAPSLLPVQTIPAVMLAQFAASLVASLLITLMFSSSSRQNFGPYFKRSSSSWIMRIMICMGIALLLYCFLGATDYKLIPQLFYDSYQINLNIPAVEVIFAIEFIKAFLIVLSLIPLIMTVGATKRFIGVICGLTLIILGCISPFLQVSNLPMFLLLASSGKIFLQNFFIGMITGAVLGNPSRIETEGISMIDYIRPPLKELVDFLSQNINNLRRRIPFIKQSPVKPLEIEAPGEEEDSTPASEDMELWQRTRRNQVKFNEFWDK